MYKKASSELVVARRRRGSHDRAEDVRVAAADRVQGPLGEDDGDDAVEARPRTSGYTSSFGLPSSGETARTANDEDKTNERPRREFARRLERFITAHQ